SLVLLTISYGAVGYFEYLFFFWMQYYFNTELQLGKETSRDYSTVIYLSMAAGMWVGGGLSDLAVPRFGIRLGRALIPVTGMLAGAALLVIGVQANDPRWIVTWFSLALGAIGATEGPQWTIAIDLGGVRGATAAGIFNTGGNIGGLLAPIFTPFISDLFGWGWAIAMGSVVCLVGAF